MLQKDSAYWASLIIEELILQKVDYFGIAPGSRNTPLTLAAARHPQAKTMVHFDERGVGFHAVGYGMGKKNPACIIVTSGSAVGNILPSLMEAYYSYVPMILLTADRPPELRDCGSNQTVDQRKLFSEYVRWEMDLPCPEAGLSNSFLREAISFAASKAKMNPPGPIHINCMFREPLYSPIEYHSLHSSPKTQFLSATPKMTEPPPFLLKKKGLILIGRMQNTHANAAILSLAKHLQWPVFADSLSGIKLKCSPNIISSYDLLLKTTSVSPPEMIFHFGDRFVSKKLLEWLTEINPVHYSFISENTDRFDPAHLFTHRFIVDPISFCESLIHSTPEAEDSAWLQEWKERDTFLNEVKLESCKEAPFIEAKAIFELASYLPSDWGVYFGNSMPIRDAEHFFFPKNPIAGIFCSRGTSGIDGNIATSFGLASGLKKPVLSCIGDLAFLHDLNSLAMGKSQKYPVLFLVLNNSGGGIFSYLKVAEEKKHFDAFIRGKHDFTFEPIAKQFGLPYQRIETLQDYHSSLNHFLLKKETGVIELIVNAEENKAFHQKILKSCQMSTSLVS